MVSESSFLKPSSQIIPPHSTHLSCLIRSSGYWLYSFRLSFAFLFLGFHQVNIQRFVPIVSSHPEPLLFILRIPKAKSTNTAFHIATMTYSTRRYDALCRLGVEQLPSLAIDEHRRSGAEQFGGMSNPLQGHLPLRGVPVPGRRCPCCLQRGQTVWVIPGKKCPQCGTEVN